MQEGVELQEISALPASSEDELLEAYTRVTIKLNRQMQEVVEPQKGSAEALKLYKEKNAELKQEIEAKDEMIAAQDRPIEELLREQEDARR